MPEWNLHEPQRQSLLGVLVYMVRNFRAIITLFITAVAFGTANPEFLYYGLLVMLPLAGFVSVLAWFQYRNFTFHVQGDELIIHRGVFFRERIVIPADRIQSLQITEHLVQRILGVVALKVDTAGSKVQELSISALELERAELLKELLYSFRLTTHTGETAPTAGSGEESHGTNGKDVAGEVLVQLGLRDLLIVGLTDNHLRTGLVALAFTFGYLSQYQEYIQEYIKGYVDEYAEQVANAGITMVLGFIFLYILFSVLLSVVRTLLRFYKLHAKVSGHAVEISTGLLKRRRDRIPISKVQYIQWETNPLRKLAGFESAVLKPTSPIGEVANQQATEIPALKVRESRLLAERVFPLYVEPDYGFRVSALAYMRFHLILWSAIVIPAVAATWMVASYQALGLLAAYPLIGFMAYRHGHSVHILLSDTYLVVKKGWIFQKRIVIPSYKVQAVALGGNVFLQKRGICHLYLYTAAGSKTVRYMNSSEAEELRDFLLYKIERYNQAWM